MKNSKSAFSLIELLVVIAIIGILAAIISIATSRLRADGKLTQCKNNLRVYGTELASYLDDNNGRFPTATEIDNPRAWFNILPERLKRQRIADFVLPEQDPTDFSVRIPNDNDFICPSMTYDRNPTQKYYCSYAINEDLVSMGKKARYQNLKSPATFVFLCETPTPDKPKINLDTIKNTNTLLSYRHGETLVICFADGHIESVTKPMLENDDSVIKWNYDEATE